MDSFIARHCSTSSKSPESVCLCARPLKPLKGFESQINTIAFVSVLAGETVSCIEIENMQSDNESQRDRKEAGGEG